MKRVGEFRALTITLCRITYSGNEFRSNGSRFEKILCIRETPRGSFSDLRDSIDENSGVGSYSSIVASMYISFAEKISFLIFFFSFILFFFFVILV